MCQYGLSLPGSDKYIRKSTRLLASHADMQELGKLCTGDHAHVEHDTVAGSWPGIGSVSQFAGAYPTQLVYAVLNTVPAFRQSQEVLEVACDDVTSEGWHQVNAVAQLADKTDAELKVVLSKLHKNLGHPPNHDLVRVLKHAQASEQALRLAKDFSCDFCQSQSRPGVPLPAHPSKGD